MARGWHAAAHLPDGRDPRDALELDDGEGEEPAARHRLTSSAVSAAAAPSRPAVVVGSTGSGTSGSAWTPSVITDDM